MGKILNKVGSWISDVKKQYKRERERILRMRRKLKKEGYEIKSEMPKIPKKITPGSVRRLQKITTRSIQEEAIKVDQETGEVITARQAKVRASRKRGEIRKLHNRIEKEEVEEIKRIEEAARRADEAEQAARDRRSWEESNQSDLSAAEEELSNIPSLVNFLIDEISTKIDIVKQHDKKWFSRQVTNILSEGFASFLDSVDKENMETTGMVEQLQMISNSAIFQYAEYLSDQVTEAKILADDMKTFAAMVNYEPINDMANEMEQFEDADEFYEFAELYNM